VIRSTFAIPVLIALASVIGLVTALTGDGWRDAAGWAGLGIPVLAVVWAWRRSRSFSSSRAARPLQDKRDYP
jgi:hypothetical protein